MPRTARPEPALQPAIRLDKRLVQRIDAVRRELQEAHTTAATLDDAAQQRSLHKRCAALVQELAGAERECDATQLGRTLDCLAKAASALMDEAATQEVRQLACQEWRKLAEAVLNRMRAVERQIAALSSPGAAQPLRAQLAQLQAALEQANRLDDYLRRMTAYRECKKKLDALANRVEVAERFAEWYQATYVSLHQRSRQDVERCPAERCRRTLLATMDLIDTAVISKLANSDIRGIESVGVRPLLALGRLATQVRAASPAIDRELRRLADRLAQLGAPAAETAQLRLLAQQKKSTWPAGATLADLERGLRSYEATLSQLARRIEQLPSVRLIRT